MNYLCNGKSWREHEKQNYADELQHGQWPNWIGSGFRPNTAGRNVSVRHGPAGEQVGSSRVDLPVCALRVVRGDGTYIGQN